jgi:hypothetical protein
LPVNSQILAIGILSQTIKEGGKLAGRGDFASCISPLLMRAATEVPASGWLSP